ncbi:hypothetical protein GW814_03340, partial [Candidatus Falkowbacteria bacterium]|nr:hypothetical protein [Candidatus Falkowbacteria bacterium]
GNYSTRFNLSGTGDFLVEDAGVPALTVTDSGNVGIGTSNPVGGVLHVEGQCVTGDSLLPVLRIDNRNSKIENQTSTFQPQDQASSFYSQPSTELIPIKDIKGGEYVLSLDQTTGKIVPARIKGLLDMGVQPVYKLTTEDGRNIRT